MNQCFEFDIEKGTWTAFGEMPMASANGGLLRYKERIYYFGDKCGGNCEVSPAYESTHKEYVYNTIVSRAHNDPTSQWKTEEFTLPAYLER